MKKATIHIIIASIIIIYVHTLYKRQTPHNLSATNYYYDKPSTQLEKILTLYSNQQEILLFETVISILRSYYFNTTNLDNKYLLKKLIAYSNKNSNISIEQNSKDITINYNQNKIKFKKNIQNDYYNLVMTLRTLKDIFDDNKPSLAKISTGFIKAINLMLQALDPYSKLLSAKEFEELKQSTEGNFGGLGIIVKIHKDLLTVIKTIPHSPAERLGISSYDQIIAIDNKRTYGKSLEELVSYMRGQPGSSVKLSLLPHSGHALKKLSLTREIITLDSVQSQTLPTSTNDNKNILIIKIDTFSIKTATEVKKALLPHIRGNPRKQLQGIILDLRGNPGGILDQAVKVADIFLNKGHIVITKGNNRNKIEQATINTIAPNTPIVVLINKHSASASEILASALQDNNRAIIIGEPSYGKGLVQTLFELPEKRALKITIAKYYTPNGDSLEHMGVTPNIWLQPIYKLSTNLNLLGTPNYNKINNTVYDSSNKPLKYYVLNNYNNIYHMFDNRNDDNLIKLARIILTNYDIKKDLYSNLKNKNVLQLLTLWEKEATNWVQKNHGIKWIKKTNYLQNIKPNLTLQIKTHKISTQQNTQVKIPLIISNLDNVKRNRISLFCAKKNGNSLYHEVLLGLLTPHGTIEHNLNFSPPPPPCHRKT